MAVLTGCERFDMVQGQAGKPVFQCGCCQKPIPEHAPVYMRDDSTYCTPGCRETGSAKQRCMPEVTEKPEIKELKEVKEVKEVRKNSGASLVTSKSQSSLATRTEVAETEVSQEDAD
ncbi:unnamed protein product, partial [Effrenium voratum]